MDRVFITGASGFVGSAITRELVRQGRQVAVLLRPTSNTLRIASQLNQLRIIIGELGNLAGISDELRRFAPTAVLHLGWEGVKGEDRNSKCQAENVGSSVKLFELTASIGCETFVGMGSQAEYGPALGRLDESAPTRPTTIYGAAKLSTGLLLDRIAATTDCKFAWLRLFSSYGPGDDPSWMLQYLARSLLAGEKPSLTAAQQLWDYIHIDDVVDALVATMDSRTQGFFNLGSGKAYKLEHVISSLRDQIDPSLPLGFGELPYRPDQVMHLEADIRRLTEAANWRPRVELKQGLKSVVDWLRDNPHDDSR